MNVKAAIAMACIFLGCCSNVVFLELLVKFDAGSGNLITFSQFLFIAVQGFVFTSKCFTKKPTIGLKDYSYLVLMFFVTSVCNNYAFDFNIPMPLHMIFRSGSLIANMIMGFIILKKRYTVSKYLSVFLITTGIIICTIVSGSSMGTRSVSDELSKDDFSALFWWTIGILLLTFALLISAAMGIYQEVLYKRFGKHPEEALFYTHILPLPGFIFIFNNIWEHFHLACNSDLVIMPMLGYRFEIPIIIVYLILNMITQYVCIRSVYVLTTECSSLTVTLVLTLRKFTSLLFSIVYFKNAFTVWHWFGTVLVFFGTTLFADMIPLFYKSERWNKIHRD